MARRSRAASTLPKRPCCLSIPFAVGALALAFAWVTAQDRSPRDALTVASFNIRYGSADDGENRWAARREMVIEVLRELDPDVAGLQEAEAHQINEIVTALQDYAVVGVGRDDGRDAGEFSAILFRKSRLHVAEAGTYWFSDTPSVPGSAHWGNRITRICTWARFIDRDGTGFWLFNLHLDHESQRSRERSTQLLRERIDSRSRHDEPVIVTGDFNAGEHNAALDTLVRSGGAGGGAPPFVDTYRALHPNERDVGTYTGFTFGKTDGDKIDYVLVPPGTRILSADIVRWSRNRRYPSDHFPVVSRLRLAP